MGKIHDIIYGNDINEWPDPKKVDPSIIQSLAEDVFFYYKEKRMKPTGEFEIDLNERMFYYWVDIEKEDGITVRERFMLMLPSYFLVSYDKFTDEDIEDLDMLLGGFNYHPEVMNQLLMNKNLPDSIRVWAEMKR
jgi:hypothetical protein